MAIVQLKGQRVSELRFVNKLENGTRVELGNQYNYSVNYSNGNVCRGEFTIEVSDKNDSSQFSIRAVVIGIFEFDTQVEKERIHVQSFKELFPYVRALITTVTANCGIPPVMIPLIDIEGQEIYRFDKNGGQ